MAELKDAAQQVKQALDQLQQATSDPNRMQQAISNAKQKIDQLVKMAEEGKEND